MLLFLFKFLIIIFSIDVFAAFIVVFVFLVVVDDDDDVSHFDDNDGDDDDDKNVAGDCDDGDLYNIVGDDNNFRYSCDRWYVQSVSIIFHTTRTTDKK